MKALECVNESLLCSQADIKLIVWFLSLGAVLQMQFTPLNKCRRNTLVGKIKPASLLLA